MSDEQSTAPALVNDHWITVEDGNRITMKRWENGPTMQLGVEFNESTMVLDGVTYDPAVLAVHLTQNEAMSLARTILDVVSTDLIITTITDLDRQARSAFRNGWVSGQQEMTPATNLVSDEVFLLDRPMDIEPTVGSLGLC